MGFRDVLSNVGNKTDFYEYFNDFFNYAVGDWVITTTEVGTGSATEVIQDGAGGQLLLTNAAGDNDKDIFQQDEASFKFVAAKRMYFGIRFKTDEATQTDIIAGLIAVDASALTHDDGIAFIMDDGDANIDLIITKNTTETESAAVGTLADDTFVTLEFYYNGQTDEAGLATTKQIEVFVDGVRVAGVALTNVPDDVDLALTFGIRNGEAVAHTMTIDWVRAFVER